MPQKYVENDLDLGLLILLILYIIILYFIYTLLYLLYVINVFSLYFCRGVAEDIVINNSEKIGGINVTVEIDESKFGKVLNYGIFFFRALLMLQNNFIGKYNRGKKVDGVWVFGGVERGSGQCFLVLVPDRSADTLLDIIKEWILPGSIIISDCWKAYNKIEFVFNFRFFKFMHCIYKFILLREHNEYIHLKVNHSLNFKDPETGAHTTK
ncbi:hypothetical protein GHT06_009899 [Daphnia sinensis]|uniref:ISXO2-like transposase domain-containing protein n=1 Tax=Daphnia sinensis TaxID=1820382 RepID=A0AAD5LGW8_9CRUS|nr:hypothetical protein GHT06_009899 [Daphnia sinensis]